MFDIDFDLRRTTGISPLHAVPSRLPDRPFGDKLRAISDLRRVNLGVYTGEPPPTPHPPWKGEPGFIQ